MVTGASSGIGLACATALSQEGGIVVGIALGGAVEGGPPLITADVSDAAEIDRAIAAIMRQHQRIDVLVVSAGVNVQGTVLSTPPQVWDWLFAVNVRGAYLTCRAVLPAMQRQQGGSIVIIGSNYGLVGGRNYAAYSATKGALVTLTKAMALDHAPDGIRVNCVCPGTVETPMVTEPMKSLTADEIAAVNARRKLQHPLGRIGQPHEIASGVVYLASAEASFVTGTVLAIDGGFTAQ